jgi:hypothetical protein
LLLLLLLLVLLVSLRKLLLWLCDRRRRRRRRRYAVNSIGLTPTDQSVSAMLSIDRAAMMSLFCSLLCRLCRACCPPSGSASIARSAHAS